METELLLMELSKAIKGSTICHELRVKLVTAYRRVTEAASRRRKKKAHRHAFGLLISYQELLEFHNSTTIEDEFRDFWAA